MGIVRRWRRSQAFGMMPDARKAEGQPKRLTRGTVPERQSGCDRWRDRWPGRKNTKDFRNPGAQGRVRRTAERPSRPHGGPRERSANGHVGAIAAVGTNAPLPQCVQRAHSIRSIRCMNAATDSTSDRIGCRHRERRTGLRQLYRLARRPQDAVVADALETPGQHMQQKAVDEGRRRHRQRPLGVTLRRSAHPEAHLTIIHPTMRSFEIATRCV
jgi:hypothetical protein